MKAMQQNHTNTIVPPLIVGNETMLAATTMTSSTATGTATMNNCMAADGLPTQFVLSMKTLFDILDDQRSGYVRLSDIERGWKDDGCKGLPRGVIEWLRNVTPPNGLLSFERFCTGLKLCLLKNQKDALIQQKHNTNNITITNNFNHHQHNNTNNNTNNNNNNNFKSTTMTNNGNSTHLKMVSRSPSAPTLIVDNNNSSRIMPTGTLWNTENHQTLPQLSPSSESEIEIKQVGVESCLPATVAYHSPPPPPKPPRVGAKPPPLPNHLVSLRQSPRSIVSSPQSSSLPSNKMQPCRKAEIRHALQNWQMNVLLNELDVKEKCKSTSPPSTFHHRHHPPAASPHQYPYRRGCADGGSSSSATESAASVNGITCVSQTHHTSNTSKKTGGAKRRDSRRHTLQNGIDYNIMMKRLRQLEDERGVLVAALNAIEKARECYLQQITNVQDKIKYLGLMGTEVEHWSDEAQQERLNFQRARILEVNRLAALAQSWDHGNYPMHLNLATRADYNKHNNNNVNSNNNSSLNHSHNLNIGQIHGGRQRSVAFLNIPPQSQSSKICDADSLQFVHKCTI